jgi:hypothetical protein
LRTRGVPIGAALAAGVLLLSGLAWAQQTSLDLGAGEDVSLECQTQLTVQFTDESTALVTCAPDTAEQANVSDSAEGSP